jgi:hypothetical protein
MRPRLTGPEMATTFKLRMALTAEPYDKQRLGVVLVMSFNESPLSAALAPLGASHRAGHDCVLERLPRSYTQRMGFSVLRLPDATMQALRLGRTRIRAVPPPAITCRERLAASVALACVRVRMRRLEAVNHSAHARMTKSQVSGCYPITWAQVNTSLIIRLYRSPT